MAPTPAAEAATSVLRDRLWAAVRIVVTVGILAGLVYKLSPGEIAGAIGDARPWPLVGAGLLMIPVQLLVLAKWRWLTRGRGIEASTPLLTRAYFQGNLLTTVLPTAIGGDVYRVYRVSREAGAGVGDVTVTVLFERATGYAAMASLGLMGAAYHFSGIAAGVAVSVALALAAVAALGVFARLPFSRLPFRDQVRKVIRDRAELQRVVWMALFSLLIQAMFISSAALIGVAFRVDVSWWYWAFTVAIVAVATLAPVALGGLGVRESSFAALLASQDAPAAAGASVGFALGMFVALVSLGALVVMELTRLAERTGDHTARQPAALGLAATGEEQGALPRDP